MDDDIKEVFDCFERTLDAEVMEINTIDAAIGGVEDIPPRSYDAPRFEVDNSGPFSNLFDPNRGIPRPPFAVLDPNRMSDDDDNQCVRH